MERNLMVAGFGGQGVMTLGKFLADATCNSTDKNVTFFPSYGAEQRGGTANCYVVIADEEIGAPLRFISPKAQALWAMSFATLRALSGRWPACDTPLRARCFLRRTRRRKKRIGSFARLASRELCETKKTPPALRPGGVLLICCFRQPTMRRAVR